MSSAVHGSTRGALQVHKGPSHPSEGHSVGCMSVRADTIPGRLPEIPRGEHLRNSHRSCDGRLSTSGLLFLVLASFLPHPNSFLGTVVRLVAAVTATVLPQLQTRLHSPSPVKVRASAVLSAALTEDAREFEPRGVPLGLPDPDVQVHREQTPVIGGSYVELVYGGLGLRDELLHL